MNANALQKTAFANEPDQPVPDEWGASAAPPLEWSASAAPPQEVARTASCHFCAQPLPPSAHHCPWCLHEVKSKSRLTPDVAGPDTSASGKTPNGAVYTLESPVRCPQCENEIRTFRVLRVLRTQVSFTSTLPRRGYVIVCPECEGLLSADLSGLI